MGWFKLQIKKNVYDPSCVISHLKNFQIIILTIKLAKNFIYFQNCSGKLKNCLITPQFTVIKGPNYIQFKN